MPLSISSICRFERNRRERKSGHHRSRDSIDQREGGGPPSVRVFAVPMHLASPDGTIPARIGVLMEYIEARLLDLDGIFRRSPDTPVLNQLRKAIDRGVDLDYDDYDGGTVACLLKAYVRELPDPLIPPELYPNLGDFFNHQGDEAVGRFIRRTFLAQMSDQTVFFLGRLMRLLSLVADHASVNKMGARNLAIVWSPNLIRHERPEDEMKTLQVCHKMIEFMITHHEELF